MAKKDRSFFGDLSSMAEKIRTKASSIQKKRRTGELSEDLSYHVTKGVNKLDTKAQELVLKLDERLARVTERNLPPAERAKRAAARKAMKMRLKRDSFKRNALAETGRFVVKADRRGITPKMAATGVAATALAALGITSLAAMHLYAADGLVNVPSIFSVEKTADRIENILNEKGITIFNRIKHSEGANKIGIELRDTELIIFGNPKVGSSGSPPFQTAPDIDRIPIDPVFLFRLTQCGR